MGETDFRSWKEPLGTTQNRSRPALGKIRVNFDWHKGRPAFDRSFHASGTGARRRILYTHGILIAPSCAESLVGGHLGCRSGARATVKGIRELAMP